MAAQTAGISVVVLPQGCAARVESIEDEVKDGLDIRFVSSMEEAAAIALGE